MSESPHAPRVKPLHLATGAGGLLAGAVVLLGLLAGRGAEAPARKLTLVAQAGRFNEANPTFSVTVGETVHLTIRNAETEPVLHDFFIAGLGVATGVLAPGETTTLVFTARQPGTYTYGCSLHPRLMDGRLVIRRQ